MIKNFGTMPDGSPVQLVKIANGGLSANIITYGASLQDLRLAGHSHSLVLGFPQFEPYLEYPYFGPFVGRVANRISQGRFELNRQLFALNKNENNTNTLHGGKYGISSINWQLVRHDENSVIMKTMDFESDTGFPGDCEITATYRILPGQILEMEIEATSNQATICNIAHHSYFNLNGDGNILDHELQISADNFLPVDAYLIPTGEIRDVDNTPFDFLNSRPIGEETAKVIDHNFCLNGQDGSLKTVAKLSGNKSQIEMEISTTEAGLQVYTGKHLNCSPVGMNGDAFRPFSGIALEPQGWPDAPNQPEFPTIILQKGGKYHQTTRFSFTTK